MCVTDYSCKFSLAIWLFVQYKINWHLLWSFFGKLSNIQWLVVPCCEVCIIFTDKSELDKDGNAIFFLFFLHTGQDTFVLQIENLYGAHVDKPMWDPQQFCLFESLWGFSVGNPTIVGWVKTHIGAPKSKTAVGPVSLPCPACLLAHCL